MKFDPLMDLEIRTIRSLLRIIAAAERVGAFDSCTRVQRAFVSRIQNWAKAMLGRGVSGCFNGEPCVEIPSSLCLRLLVCVKEAKERGAYEKLSAAQVERNDDACADARFEMIASKGGARRQHGRRRGLRARQLS